VDDVLVRDKIGLGKTDGEIRHELVLVGADQDGADARRAKGDQHLADGAFAARIEDGIDGCKPRGDFEHHERNSLICSHDGN